MTSYINYEDYILEKINEVINSSSQSSNIEETIEEFNKYWKKYQDTWNKNYWNIYNRIRSNEEKHLKVKKFLMRKIY
jgi:hypothetical protein